MYLPKVKREVNGKIEEYRLTKNYSKKEFEDKKAEPINLAGDIHYIFVFEDINNSRVSRLLPIRELTWVG